jgi:hypothetical protein
MQSRVGNPIDLLMNGLSPVIRADTLSGSLNESLAYGKDAYGQYWLVEPQRLPEQFTDLHFDYSASDGVTIKANAVSSGDRARSALLELDRGPGPAQRELRKTLGDFVKEWERGTCDPAIFHVTYWESLKSGFIDEPLEAPRQTSNYDEDLRKIRTDLQAWLGVSVDELARLVNLSPATVVNLGRGRRARPKTARKVLAVHGLLRELQSAIGTSAALAWCRTTGRRLLEEGRQSEFEMLISIRLFPAPRRTARATSSFGDFDADFPMKLAPPIGRPSRL